MGKRRSVSKSGDGAPWSDLEHCLLCLVMMKLEVIDFQAFSGVCKSWRILALSNKSRFMASRPPMSIWISEKTNNKKEYFVEDFGERQFKMRLPKSGNRTCVGLSCGYLVLHGTKPRDFLLMNPVARHGIRFPKFPGDDEPEREGVRAILVFSPSISAWVFVVLFRYTNIIWFSIAGKGAWDYVSLRTGIIDVHDFKGKIYAIDIDSCLYEVGLDPKPKLMLLKTKNMLKPGCIPMFMEFVCSDENLYAMECHSPVDFEVHKLDFGEMKWVSLKKKISEEYTFFVSELKHSAAIKQGLWSESESWLRYKKLACSCKSGNGTFVTSDLWYFPHDCLKVNLKHE